MIKAFIQWNKGNPRVAFKALYSDKNSINVLRLIEQAAKENQLTLTEDPDTSQLKKGQKLLVLDTNLKLKDNSNG